MLTPLTFSPWAAEWQCWTPEKAKKKTIQWKKPLAWSLNSHNLSDLVLKTTNRGSQVAVVALREKRRNLRKAPSLPTFSMSRVYSVFTESLPGWQCDQVFETENRRFKVKKTPKNASLNLFRSCAFYFGYTFQKFATAFFSKNANFGAGGIEQSRFYYS